MGKTCAELFCNVPCTIIGDGEEEVARIVYRSSDVRPGDAFFCIVGTRVDGHSFAQDAIDRGAKVLVVERNLYLADATDVTEVVVDDSRKAMAIAAANFFGRPSDALDVVGVTGTNGKTTTTYLIEQVLRYAGRTCGVIGTLGVKVGDAFDKTSNTTPESSDLQGMLGRMVEAGCDSAAIEVSSHALDLLRTWGMRFAVTAFTNLTRDHLDYHHTFEAYFEAKALLFGEDYPAKRVICTDDSWGRLLYARCLERGDECLTTGFDERCAIHPVSVEYFPGRTSVVLCVRGEEFAFDYPLAGRFNVSNMMTALACALQLGIDAKTAVEALSQVVGVAGRLQRVEAGAAGGDGAGAVGGDGGVSVYVDYAHTPDAIEKAIAALREVCAGRLIIVFGCGGDRDATKRSIMGKVALGADYAVVTSDNPRSEDPLAIIADIEAGMAEGAGRYCVEPDRRRAIAAAIGRAEPGDAVLIAGKGHENYQILADKTIDFSDYDVAVEELRAASRR